MAVQALAAVLGGTQSLHTNSFDEAIALPTEKAARLALRTQQVLAYETDVPHTADPFAGSYAVERMTDEVEAAALALMRRVEELGGAVAAIEAGFQKAEIEASAYRIAREQEAGSGSSSGSTASRWTGRSRTRRWWSTRGSRPASARRWNGCGPGGTAGRWRRRWRRCGRRRARSGRTSCTR